MEYDKNNIFARILRKEIPANIVYEDDYALAFHDINPKAPIHVLVIPKAEYVSFFDFSDKAPADLVHGFTKAIHHAVKALDIQKEGFRLLANHGLYASQEVFHYHVHILGGRPLGPMLLPA